MRKIFTAFIVWLALGGSAFAASCSGYPYTLTNGQTADANQVMANLNTVMGCLLSNAASSGANTDITQLLGLTSPLTPAQGGTPVFLGGTTTGSVNAQVVTTSNPSSFTLTPGYVSQFFAGFTNTGATTLNYNSTGAISVLKMVNGALVALVAGDIQSGVSYYAAYDGTRYELLNPSTCQQATSSIPGCVEPDGTTITAASGVISAVIPQGVPSGTVASYAGSTAPSGWFLTYGECESKTTYATLYTAIGDTWTTPDSCSSGNFGLPDLRGRAVYGVDAMGGTPAGVLGSGASGGITGTASLGAIGGQQEHTLLASENAALSLTIPGSGGSFSPPAGGGSILVGGGSAHNVLNPALVLNYIIKQ